MSGSETSTCWTMIRSAAGGGVAGRDEFARQYGPIIRAYFAARWKGTGYVRELEDACQEVFVECFRQGGALENLDEDRARSFRSFLFGVVRNVSLRVEKRKAQSGAHREALDSGQEIASRDEALSQIYDRAWAQQVMKQAVRLMNAEARRVGDPAATRRFEILRLRFSDNLPIREIAMRWGGDAAELHRDYARARREFKDALLKVISRYHTGSPALVEQEATCLLAMLGT